MARFDDISDEARRTIVAQAGPLLTRHDRVGLGAGEQPLVLGPSLREELLTLETIRGAGQAVPQPTGQTVSLLQIPSEHSMLGSGPPGSTRSFGHVLASTSAPAGLGGATSDGLSVRAVSASDLSARIQGALDWIDRNVGDDPVVRVMTVPAYHLTALALHSGEKVVGVLALPSEHDTRFESRRVYGLDEFIERLRELPTAEGLTP
jgi:hypothetical protein